VSWRQDATEFPNLPGVRYPQVVQQRPTATWSRLSQQGHHTKEPPDVLGQYTILVPKSDADGIDLGLHAAC